MARSQSVLVAAVLLAFVCSMVQGVTVSISQNTTSISEAGGVAAITFTQSSAATTIVTFTVGGTAVYNTDYTVSGALSYATNIGTVQLTPASLTTTIYLTALQRSLVNGDHTVVLTIQSDVTYSIGVASVTTTIVNNNFNNVTVASVGPSSLASTSNNTFVFQFTRTGDLTLALPVTFSLGGSAAVLGRWSFTNTTYVTVQPSNTTAVVTFPAGVSAVNITVGVADDGQGHQPETIIFTLQPGSLYIINSPSFTVVTLLTTNPDSVTISVSGSPVLSSDGTTVTFTVTRAGSVGIAPLSVNFTIGGTAVINSDYTYSGPAINAQFRATLNFGITDQSLSFSFVPIAFTVLSPDKTVTATLLPPLSGSGQNYTLLPASASSATAVIKNDVAAVSLIITPGSANVNPGGTFQALFVRTGYSGFGFDVAFAISGTAVLNTDYTVQGATSISTSSGVATIQPGASNVTLNIQVVGSTAIAASKSFTWTLSTVMVGADYTLASPIQATATIVNNNQYPVSIFGSPTSLSQGSTSNFVVTISASGSVASALTVGFSVGGSAVYGQHYTVTGAAFSAQSGQVTLASGANPSASFQISPLPNPVPGSPNTIVLSIASGSGYQASGLSTLTLTIINLPLPSNTISLTVSPSSVDQNDALPLVYSFVRSGDTTSALNFNFALSGTAVIGTDYTLSGGTVASNVGTATFQSGTNLAVISVYPILTLNNGASKTVTLSITGTANYLVDSVLNIATGTITDSGLVTINNLQPVVTTVTGFGLVDLRLPAIRQISTAAVRVDIANLLQLPSQYVGVPENKFSSIIVQLFDITGTITGATLAQELILLVNGPTVYTSGTNVTRASFYPATAYSVPTNYLSQSTLTATVAPIAIPPPPRFPGAGNGVGGAGQYYYYRPIVVLGRGSANALSVPLVTIILSTLALVLFTSC